MDLIKWDKLKAEIATTKDIVKLSQMDSGVEAVQRWAKQSNQSKETQDEIGEYRIQLNVARGKWVEQNIPDEPKEAGKLGGRPSKNLAKNGQVLPTLKAAGIGHHESTKLRDLAKIPEPTLNEFIEKTKNSQNELTIKSAFQFAKKVKKEKKRKDIIEVGSAVKTSLVEIGDIRKYETKKQFDFIITDPPYPKEYLDLFSILAERTKEWLKPTGLLVVMSGQSYLDQVYKMLSEHLTYYWTACYLTPGQPTPLRTRQVNTTWKPILIYRIYTRKTNSILIGWVKKLVFGTSANMFFRYVKVPDPTNVVR